MKDLKLSYDKMISLLNEAGGRLIVPSMNDNVIQEAHDMITQVSISLSEHGQDEENRLKWIPITYRDADEEEQEDGSIYMLTCPLPEENVAVLISTGHHVHIDTMCYDNGWYFDSYGDIRDIDAWMPLPEPFRGEG